MSVKDHFLLDGRDLVTFIIGFGVIFIIGFIIGVTLDITQSKNKAKLAKEAAPKPLMIKEFSYNDEEIRIYKDPTSNEIYGEIIK